MVVQEKRYTIAEFTRFTELPENKNRLFELIDGEIVEKVASFTPSRIAVRIARFLDTFAESLGYVTGADGSYILSPDYEFMPDVGYISKIRLPQEPAGKVDGPPDLAVEVKSPTDSKRELRLKAEDYLRFGTKMVWLVFPDDQRVEVYIPDADVRELSITDTLDGGTVLTGFTLPVREIFPPSE
ncbi:MAG: Uma2 family endonuclease [Anaerolineae bacterium]|nr:Uma2 family endonuclease [Anaerolineae bacterium]